MSHKIVPHKLVKAAQEHQAAQQHKAAQEHHVPVQDEAHRQRQQQVHETVHRAKRGSFEKLTCHTFWREYSKQSAVILKTATAIVVALLWSTTISSLLDVVYANFFTDYDRFELWTSFGVTSMMMIVVTPVLSFRYLNPEDYWAIMLMIEILGHLWGFKIKDLIVHYSYSFHALADVFRYHTSDIDASFSYCNLVTPTLYIDTVDSGLAINATTQGWIGYNLDWTSYVQSRDVFDTYYASDPCDNATTNDTRRQLGGSLPAPSADCSRRRELAAAATIPSPSPFDGERTDIHIEDSTVIGPGRTCNFEYRTTQVLRGFRVEKSPREVYLLELGSRMLIWIVCLVFCIISVVVIRAIYNKVVFPKCCRKAPRPIIHNWSHIQNHLIADAWANGMGWASSWFFWWFTIYVIMWLANLTQTSPCNGMHAFPLMSVAIGLSVFFALVSSLLFLRVNIWARMIHCWPPFKEWLGGVGALQNGFMLGWFLISWVTYFHGTFVSPYIEEGFEDYSPFDDIYESHPAPTMGLAFEELGEALFWTFLGLLYITHQALHIKRKHTETALLKEAKRRLNNYFTLTKSFAATVVAKDVATLIDKRKRAAILLEKRASITSRGLGIWMGLTIELAIHLFISLMEVEIIDLYEQSSSAGASSYSSYAYSGGYSGSYYYGYAYVDYTDNAIQRSIVFAMNFVTSSLLTGILFAVMFCSHHMSWRISTENERRAAVVLQAALRGFKARTGLVHIWTRRRRAKQASK